jgi:hypothetical protein
MALPNVPVPAGQSATNPNIPSWEDTSLNQLYSAGLLSGVSPEILSGVVQAESSGQGGGINSAGYGGYFGLGESSTYGPGYTTSPALLQGTNQSAFDTQAEIAAYEFNKLLGQYGDNPYSAEQAYQTGSPSGSGEGDAVLKALGIGGSDVPGYGPGGAAGAYTPGGASAAGSNIAALLGGQMTPQTISQLISDLGLSGQSALSQQMLQLQQGILGANYGYAQQQFGVQTEEWQQSYTNLQQQQQYEIAEYGYQQQQNTLSGQNITAAINNIVQQFGVQSQQLGLARQQAYQGNAASGVYNTGTQKQTAESFNLQQQALQISEQYQLFQESQAQKSLALTEAEQREQYGYSQQQIADGANMLKYQLQSLGISEQQAATQFQNALSQLGLNNVMNADQLMQQVAIMAGGGYSPMTSMLGQLIQAMPGLSGLFTGSSGGG